MSLSASLGIATSSLRTIQTRLAVASNNIANADNPNYTAKRAEVSTRISGGEGYGVDITSIAARVDTNLLRGIVSANSGNRAAQTLFGYMKALSSTLGSLTTGSGEDTLSSRLTALQNALDKVSGTPESAPLKAQAVSALDDAATSLRSLSGEVQKLRGNADADIAKAVTASNEAMRTIASLNIGIVRAKAAGQPTGDLEDQRNAALQKLSGHLDVSGTVDANGAMTVSTGTGQVLVGSEVHELRFTPTARIDGGTVYPGGLSGITLDGQTITGSIASGSLSALIKMRDSTLPALQKDLDTIAVSLRDTLNGIANGGSAVPPPNSLTGTSRHAATDALNGSGTLRIAITGANGKVTDTRDIDLSAHPTVGSLVAAINAVPGLSARLDDTGRLMLRTTQATSGVALAGGSIGGKNVSGAFGLNDVLTGTGAADVTVKPDLAANPGLMPSGALPAAASLTAGSLVASSGSGALTRQMADGLRAAKLANAASDLIAGTGAAMNAAKSRANVAETGLNTLTSRFSSQYGVNVDEENAKVLELQQAYSASAHILSVVRSTFSDLLSAVR